jgi:hypothetical protein
MALGEGFPECVIFSTRGRHLSRERHPRSLFPECCTRGRLPRVFFPLPRVPDTLGEASVSCSASSRASSSSTHDIAANRWREGWNLWIARVAGGRSEEDAFSIFDEQTAGWFRKADDEPRFLRVCWKGCRAFDFFYHCNTIPRRLGLQYPEGNMKFLAREAKS